MMRKLILLACFAVVFCFASSAQFKIGANLNVGIPTGDMSDYVGVGVGGTITGLYSFSDHFAAGVQTGYLNFTDKDNNGVTFSVVPVTAVAKCYFSKSNFKPYVSADLGFYVQKLKSSASMYGYTITASASETDFGFAPALGFEYFLSKQLSLDANAKYTNICASGSATTYFGINLGLVYKF